MSPFKEAGDSIEIRLKVVPGASRSRIVGLLGDAVKVQVAAAPERGKANATVEVLIADALEIAASCVSVISGMTTPRKVVRVRGVTLIQVAERFGL